MRQRRVWDAQFRLNLTHIHSIRVRFKRDRKSTRLNSSHTVISYAVFCLKKKKKIESTESDPLINGTFHDCRQVQRSQCLVSVSRVDRRRSRKASYQQRDGRLSLVVSMK